MIFNIYFNIIKCLKFNQQHDNRKKSVQSNTLFYCCCLENTKIFAHFYIQIFVSKSKDKFVLDVNLCVMETDTEISI